MHTYTQRQTDTYIQTDRPTDRQTDLPTDRQTNRQTGRQAGRQTDRQTDRQIDRQTDRQRCFFIHKNKMVELRALCLHVLIIMIILPPRAVKVFVVYQDFVKNMS